MENKQDRRVRRTIQALPQHMRCTKTQQIYLYEFIFTGMLGVVQKWVRSGCEEDPHEISHLIWETFLHIVE